MDQLKKRREGAANMWETTSLSGVKVYPMRAAVQAMINQGYNMDAALGLLSHAEKCYVDGKQDKLLVWIARINSSHQQGDSPCPRRG